MTSQPDMIFEHIAAQLVAQHFVVIENGLPSELKEPLQKTCKQHIESQSLDRAGIGRNTSFQQNIDVRQDQIQWIDKDSDDACTAWLKWTHALQTYLNKELYLGINSFESHFAHYPVNAFYKKHLDAFKGKSNRILSLVTYLNDDWNEEQGGELVMYSADNQELARVQPKNGTLVLFMSEMFPHEVMPATRERMSIAGWFRNDHP